MKNTNAKAIATDFPGYAGEVILLAILETNLSIINACLPLMQPVLTSVSTKVRSILTSTSITLVQGRFKPSQRDVRFQGSEDAQFKRLHDNLYPLSFNATTQLSDGVGTINEIEGVRGYDCADVEMDDLRHMEQAPVKEDRAIKVTKTWNVSPSRI